MKQSPQKQQKTSDQTERDGQSIENDRLSRPRRSWKRWIYLALGISVCLVIIWSFRPTPIAVDTATVERGELQVTVNAEGKTRVRDRYVVSANVAGQLERIQLEAGDAVTAGTIVAQIEPLPLNASMEQALAQLVEWQAERVGVATQRPKAATLEQAESRIRSARAQQREADAKVAAAVAALDQAERDRQRSQSLAASGAISRQEQEIADLNATTKTKDLEALRLTARAAAAEVEVAQAALTVLQQEQRDPDYLLKVYDARIASVSAELAKLQDDAQRTVIRSPVSGRVLRVNQKSAQFVTAGTPLLEIADPGRLELVMDVLSSDALQIQPGDAIQVYPGSELPPLAAKVRFLEPAAFTKVSALGVEEQRVNVIGDFNGMSDFVKPAQLGDAYRVDVQIIVWHHASVLQVPLSALFRCQRSNWCTFVVRQGRAAQQTVAIGQRSDVAVEIRQGLQPGEQVILHPSEQVKSDRRVKPR